MKSYLSLIPISAKVHRRQSRMTRICIILAVFLVTSIFSMAEMWTESETTVMRQNHGDWHISLQNVPDDKAEQIIVNSDVAFSSWYDAINVDADKGYYIGGKNVTLYGVEETYPARIMNYPTEGSYPQNEKEVALSADAKELWGVKIGDNITLNTPDGDLKYTISGFYEDDTEFNKIIDGACVYMNRVAFNEVCSLNGVAHNSQFYIRFEKESGLKKTIANLKQQYNLNAENIKENTGVLGMLGASSNESVDWLYPLAAACFVIILISGVFMISSCMNSNVAQRTKFFGMMRCIGASKQQIVRFVRLEALNWCKTAVPIGLILGVVTTWGLCAVLRFVVREEFSDIPLFGISIFGIVCGIFVGLITVLIAANAPAKHAAKVSPITAVSGNADHGKTMHHCQYTGFGKIEALLGIDHAVSGKKNLFLMTGSFALSIILFLSFSVMIDFVDYLIPQSAATSDIDIASDDGNAIPRELLTSIRAMDGVREVYGRRSAFDVPARLNSDTGFSGTTDMISYDDFDLQCLKKDSALKRGSDLSKVFRDSNFVLATSDQDSTWKIGDTVQIGDETLTIAGLLKNDPFSENGLTNGKLTLITSDETFVRLTGEEGYSLVLIQTTGDVTDENVQAIQNSVDQTYSFRDKRDERTTGTYLAFVFCVYAFLAIIALVTVMNIVNSISMSVSARMKQYGAMRAVGMDERQMTKMIACEAFTYAVLGCVVGCAIGLPLSKSLYDFLIAGHFPSAVWQFPIISLGVILLFVSIAAIAAVYAPAKRIRNMSITATINEL